MHHIILRREKPTLSDGSCENRQAASIYIVFAMSRKRGSNTVNSGVVATLDAETLVVKSHFRQYGRMKSRDGKSQRREEKKKIKKKGKIRKKKIQVREKVGKSRSTVFFQ